MKRILTIIALLCCIATVTIAADKKFTLVIDAGHGGKDPGTRGKQAREKDIALKTALAFGKYVEQNCPDVKVIYTRKTDVFIELKERAAIANRNHADLFVSIHVNSVESRRPVTGIEVYSQGMRRSDEKLSAAQRENSVILLEKDYKQHYKGYDPNSPESDILFDMMFDKYMENSVEISSFIQKRLQAAGRPGRVKQDNFAVLRLTALPACLVELGYITTPSEEQYMCNNANLDKMALAIFQGFQDYRKKFSGVEPVAILPPALPEPAPAPYQPAMNPAKPKEEPAPPAAEPTPEPVAEEAPAEPSQQAATPTQPTTPDTETTQQAAATAQQSPTLLFKVQLFISRKQLKAGDPLLKGITDFEYYEEGGYKKYTTGSSPDYNAIAQLRRQIADRFPEAFIIAFRDGQKTNVQQAIQEFKRNKK